MPDIVPRKTILNIEEVFTNVAHRLINHYSAGPFWP